MLFVDTSVRKKTGGNFFFNVVGDEESTNGSLDFVITGTSLLEEYVLHRVETLSQGGFKEETSSKLSIGEKIEIFKSQSSLLMNVSFPLISEISN